MKEQLETSGLKKYDEEGNEVPALMTSILCSHRICSDKSKEPIKSWSVHYSIQLSEYLLLD